MALEATDAAAPQTVYFNGEQAVYDSGRTYIAYLGLERDLYVTYYDHAAETFASHVEVGAYPIADNDNHGAPTICLDGDGHIHVVWGSHNTTHRHSVSDSPGDISAWSTSTITGAGTYPIVRPFDGDLYLVDRPGSGHSATFPSHEYESLRVWTGSWSAAAELIDTTGSPESDSDVYLSEAKFHTDDRLHMVWTVARGSSHDGTRINVYHAAYDPSDGNMYAADDTNLGAVVTWAEHVDCLVWEGRPVSRAKLVFGHSLIVIPHNTSNISSAMVSVYGSGWTTYDTHIYTNSVPTLYPTVSAWRMVIKDGGGSMVVYESPGTTPTDWQLVGLIEAGDFGTGWSIGSVLDADEAVALAIQNPEVVPTSATGPDLRPLMLVVDD